MSHFAEIDNNNQVLRVLVGPNYGDEGQAFFEALGGRWVKTSYNGNIRKNYAGIGYTFDGTGFYAPQCHDEATLNTDTYLWDCTNADHDIKEITNDSSN